MMPYGRIVLLEHVQVFDFSIFLVEIDISDLERCDDINLLTIPPLQRVKVWTLARNNMNSLKYFIQTLGLTESAGGNRDSGERF